MKDIYLLRVIDRLLGHYAKEFEAECHLEIYRDGEMQIVKTNTGKDVKLYKSKAELMEDYNLINQ